MPGRKAIVVITDGLDSGSIFVPEAAMKAARNRADASSSTAFTTSIMPLQRNKSDSFPGEEALRKLAEPTGGRMFHVGWGMPLKTVFNTIREEMRNQYAIGYTSTNRVKDGSYRRLEIKQPRPGLKIQARQGYYANPVSPPALPCGKGACT